MWLKDKLLIFPECFQKTGDADSKNQGLVLRKGWMLFKTVSLTLYHRISTFDDPETDGFWKHCGKKEKMLVTSIFSFSHYVFFSIKKKKTSF